ncbi:hypothetical protein [Desulfovibrio inopinatus]|uniref:hypothetical protein n=1 Tax=Desulfovibrio inopinatus TaxID=102109 RepID=UPI0012EC6AC9|nr:hypothetical protein [Desulfovibrio inopinatus]
MIELPNDPRILRRYLLCPKGESSCLQQLHEDCLDEAEVLLRSIGLRFAAGNDSDPFKVKWIEK